jgi:hypothetical protein
MSRRSAACRKLEAPLAARFRSNYPLSLGQRLHEPSLRRRNSGGGENLGEQPLVGGQLHRPIRNKKLAAFRRIEVVQEEQVVELARHRGHIKPKGSAQLFGQRRERPRAATANQDAAGTGRCRLQSVSLR